MDRILDWHIDGIHDVVRNTDPLRELFTTPACLQSTASSPRDRQLGPTCKFEEWAVSLKKFASKLRIRPIQMLLTRICFSVNMYMSFVCGFLYANLAAFLNVI